jgi:hypothetical protein
MESTPVLRKWVAISAVSAAIERKVWLDTGQPLFPNLYIWLVGPAAIGKSRPIGYVRNIAREAGLHISKDKLTSAGLIDTMREDGISQFTRAHHEIEMWNSMFVVVSELSVFMSDWDPTMGAILTNMWDCDYYSEAKRGDNHRLDIEKPHLVMLCGCTPASLLQAVPDVYWSQGMMSRVILIHTKEKDTKDILDMSAGSEAKDLIKDLAMIKEKPPEGLIVANQDFKDLFHTWRREGCHPVPTNPRLRDYAARRDTHFLKLAMVACVDRGGPLVLTADDFKTTMDWLLEAELPMGKIFIDGAMTHDARQVDDVIDWIAHHGPLTKMAIQRIVEKKFQINQVKAVMETMITTGRIVKDGKFWRAPLD